jgi:hypothetical protein
MPARGQARAVVSGVTEQIGEVVEEIGPEFDIKAIRQRLPNISVEQIYKTLARKVDQEVIERIDWGKYRLLQRQFTRIVPMGTIANAVWRVLDAHRSQAMLLRTIILAVRVTAGDMTISNDAVRMVLHCWYRDDHLERTGWPGTLFYRLRKDVTRQPVTNSRK